MPSAPTLARVLCATDLSDFGNRAVPVAFSITPDDGTLTLLHVLHTPALPSPLLPHYGEKHASPEELARAEQACAERLEARAREAAGARRVDWQVRVVRGTQVSDAILAEAARDDAQLICLATHAREGLAKLVLGSTAHDVLHRTGRPVLLIPPPMTG
ncbi:MAG: universal stress protein [Myxococcota bacterium]